MSDSRKRPRIVVTRKIPDNGTVLLKEYFTVDLNRQERDLTLEEA
jgi:hypothetical protein